jgi:hypothetical protein
MELLIAQMTPSQSPHGSSFQHNIQVPDMVLTYFGLRLCAGEALTCLFAECRKPVVEVEYSVGMSSGPRPFTPDVRSPGLEPSPLTPPLAVFAPLSAAWMYLRTRPGEQALQRHERVQT